VRVHPERTSRVYKLRRAVDADDVRPHLNKIDREPSLAAPEVKNALPRTRLQEFNDALP
jgi:hypothetical protein